jgi:hypothetical protein
MFFYSVQFNPSLDIGNICLNLLVKAAFWKSFLDHGGFLKEFSAERSLLGYEE